ncbi:Predicted oxidoreductase [Quadrisphaera granulorum]|uniref:Aryl-alcohol dehydrogenase-like predicted oxidoreductase n=1 Tax=Quadrisphaera granulorum TaxID=317664 RepID=A0A315ZQB0_9ACTN|nr:aldo/keto reductase [Quadrisphaera granulorum]PWJ47482.1 aryl-alcohol dehydrogenase-like predicted oxidoreductase [Quadrisphaera granulorum]SZE98783.1 Predicted oxidoreductase [Quadrisphaera granulorum]
MEQRALGRSGLTVSTMTMGTASFGGGLAAFGDTQLDGAQRQLAMAKDAGVTLVDTADAYSTGLSEEIVGEALAGQRDDWLIATKVRFPMGDGPNDRGLSRHHVISGCEASLRRLRTDHIDLYQLHEWDGQTPVEETLAALTRLVDSGKVRYVGVSNFSAWHLMKMLSAAERDRYVKPVAQQIYYTLESREAENELLPAAADQGLGVLVWSPLAGGLLSGKYTRGADGTVQGPKGSRHLGDWHEPPINTPDRLFATIDVLREIADGRGVSGAQVALAWLLTRPTVTSVIVGARTDEQLADNLAAASLELSADEVAALERVSRQPLQYPYWHQAMTASDRLGPADQVLHANHT